MPSPHSWMSNIKEYSTSFRLRPKAKPRFTRNICQSHHVWSGHPGFVVLIRFCMMVFLKKVWKNHNLLLWPRQSNPMIWWYTWIYSKASVWAYNPWIQLSFHPSFKQESCCISQYVADTAAPGSYLSLMTLLGKDPPSSQLWTAINNLLLKTTLQCHYTGFAPCTALRVVLICLIDFFYGTQI